MIAAAAAGDEPAARGQAAEKTAKESAAAADDKASSAEAKESSQETADEQAAFLGVGVEALHPAFATHMPDAFARGQGLLVAYVTPDSPAEKAGLKPHDVLMTYDDQKLFAAEQLAKLVDAAKPKDTVSLNIVRGGQKKQIKVELGAQPDEQTAFAPGWGIDAPWDWMGRDLRQTQARSDDDGGTADQKDRWKSFDSLSMRKTGDKQWKVDIKYLDKNGKLEQHSFEGTRAEIRHDVEQQKDIPSTEREQLLNALSSARSPGNFHPALFSGFAPWEGPF
jgi:hypothetical protein